MRRSFTLPTPKETARSVRSPTEMPSYCSRVPPCFGLSEWRQQLFALFLGSGPIEIQMSYKSIISLQAHEKPADTRRHSHKAVRLLLMGTHAVSIRHRSGEQRRWDHC